MRRTLYTLAAAALLSFGIAGCGGDDGAAGPAGPPGAPGAPGPAGPPGSAAIVLTPSTPAATFAELDLSGSAVTAVSISSPPVVTFRLATGEGVPIIGYGSTAKAANATVASYPNIAFSLAKLVPAAGGTPSKWISYIVTTVPVTTSSSTCAANAVCLTRPSTDNTGTLVDNGDGTYTYTFYRDVPGIKAVVDGITPPANTATANYDKAQLGDLTYDPNATHRLTIQLSGNAPGTGTNTANAVQSVAGVPLARPVDLVYDFVPATGQPPAASANRKITTTTNCNACHSTLGGLPALSDEANAAGFHGGSRNNVEYCVVCHTDQRKWGRVEATNAGFPTLAFSTSTTVVDGRAVGNLPNMIHKTHLGHHLAKQGYDYAGVAFNHVGYPQDSRNCQNCHSADTPEKAAVTPQGDNWKVAPSRLACGACHDGINFDTGEGITLRDAAKARRLNLPYAPSTHFNGKAHVGNATDAGCTNSGCHGVENGINAIEVAHIPVTPPNEGSSLHVNGGSANTNAAWIASGANVNRLPKDAIKVTYEVKDVRLANGAARNPQIVFRMLQNGTPTALNNPADPAAVNPKTGRPEIWPNFMGAPSCYFVWSVPQDGVAAPNDFNATASAYVRTLWLGSAAGTLVAGAGADAGYYVCTLTNTTVAANAKMFTGGIGYSYNASSTLPLTQTNVTGYPVPQIGYEANYVAPGAQPFPNPTGGLIVIAPNVQKVGTGFTGRRAIVEDKRCNACHQELGTFTEDAFHAGQRNDGTTCSWCHTPNRTSSAWSADSVPFVHAIHGASKRTVDYTWHALGPSHDESFAAIGYPGVLSNCEQCHIPGSYDFANAASADAAGITDGVNKRLPRTVGVGFYVGTAGNFLTTYSGAGCATTAAGSPQSATGAYSLSPYVDKSAMGDGTNPNVGTYYGFGFGHNAGIAATNASCSANGTVLPALAPGETRQASPETLIVSPTVAACTGCHDSPLAISHMQVNGGAFYESRTATGLVPPYSAPRVEQCMVCHSSGKIADTKVVHVDKSK